MGLKMNFEMVVVFELFSTNDAFVSHSFVVKFDMFVQFAVGVVPFRAFITFKLILIQMNVIYVQPKAVFVQTHLVAIVTFAGEFPQMLKVFMILQVIFLPE